MVANSSKRWRNNNSLPPVTLTRMGDCVDNGSPKSNGHLGLRHPGGGELSANESGTSSSSGSDTVELKKTLGLPSGVAVVLGTIVGSGIFVSPKGVLIHGGSVGESLIIWAVCGFICLLGAHSFAELGTCIRKTGGMYSYIQAAFGNFVAFLYLWIALLIIFPAANAVIALTFGYYILQPMFPDCDAPDAAVRLLAAIAISVLTFVNCASVRWAARVQDIFTMIKTLALVIIIVTGIVVISRGDTTYFNNSFENSKTDIGSLSLALYSGLFSYSGWYALNFLTEELKNPYQNLPRAIWISMPLVTLIYVLVNVSYFAVLSIPQIIASDAVAVTFAMKMFGLMAWCMPIFVAFSTFGSLNGCIMAVARVFFVGAREGHLPEALALINIKRFTPLPAVVLEGAISIAMLCTSDVMLLINYVTFIESLTQLICVLALLWLRYKQPNLDRPIKVNIIFPIIFTIVCTFLVIVPIFQSPYESGMGLFITATGIPVYLLGVMWKKPAVVQNFMKKFTCGMQKIILGVHQEGKIGLD